jgi:HSP20 family protein
VPERKEEGKKRVQVKGGTTGGREERGIAPWRPDDYLTRMDRAFEDFESRFDRMLAPFPGGWFGPRGWLELPEVRRPSADLIDSGKEYKVMAEVPGIPKEKLDITVTDGGIKIEGEARTDVHEEKEGFVRRERGYSRISRTLSFPEPVESGKAEATLNNGVLEVKVPKKTPTDAKKHKVAVR